MAGDEIDSRGVMSPDESGIWHLVETPLAARALRGKLILYGARMRAWAQTPEADRCSHCLGSLRVRPTDPTLSDEKSGGRRS